MLPCALKYRKLQVLWVRLKLAELKVNERKLKVAASYGASNRYSQCGPAILQAMSEGYEGRSGTCETPKMPFASPRCPSKFTGIFDL